MMPLFTQQLCIIAGALFWSFHDTAMNIDHALSSYLNFLRFLAAAIVLMGHMEQDGLYMKWLPLYAYSHEAVIVFFVMSGFIIQSSTVRSHRHWRSYLAARLTRVYSVALPAVFFCSVLALAISNLTPLMGTQFTNYRPYSFWDVVSSLLFLNESPGNSARLSLNAPYWSLCYEVWYYILFGIYMFLRGNHRAFWLMVASAIAGPAILVLLPVWLTGVLLAREAPHLRSLRQAIAWPIFLGTIGIVILINVSGISTISRVILHDHIPGFWRLESSERFATDYVIGIMVAANIYSFSHIHTSVRAFFVAHSRTFEALAGFSFTMYLFHRPLTQLAGYYLSSAPQTIVRSLTIYLSIILVCFLISHVTERRLSFWRTQLDRLLPSSQSPQA